MAYKDRALFTSYVKSLEVAFRAGRACHGISDTGAFCHLGFLLETTVRSIMAAGRFPCRKENKDSHSDMVHSLSTKDLPEV